MSENKTASSASVHSIVLRPWDFACDWYKAEDIHRVINQRAGGFGEKVSIPEDVRSIEFARFLAEQYQLAMRKGAELATSEMQGRLGLVNDEVGSVLSELDHLAEVWGDEGVFRRCRDRLRKLLSA